MSSAIACGLSLLLVQPLISCRVDRSKRFRICTGKRSPAVPATPGCVRDRTRRFGELSLVRCSQTGDAERVEIGIWHSEAECRTVSDSPWAIWAARRLGGEVTSYATLAEFRKPFPPVLPLFPKRRPQPAPKPLIKAVQYRGRLTETEIA